MINPQWPEVQLYMISHIHNHFSCRYYLHWHFSVFTRLGIPGPRPSVVSGNLLHIVRKVRERERERERERGGGGGEVDFPVA